MKPARAFLLLLFLLPALMKIIVSAGTSQFGTDGSYYADIARHVEEGHGLQTRISLFHHGYEEFPHPSPVYPLWPLVLGLTARLVGLDAAAVWLPTLLYFTTILFAWLWARELPRAPLFARFPDGPDTAHIAALLIGWNAAIFDKTSQPYTEGLAFTLLFAFLWRGHRLWERRGWIAGAEAGLWIGVIFLVRSQLVLLAMAAACTFALALVAAPQRRRTLAMAISTAVVAVGVVLPHYLRLRESTLDPAVGILRFELAQANTLLSPVDVLTDETGLAVLLDRLSGVPIAFSVMHPLAYMRIFYGMQYAFVLAVPVLLALAWTRRRELGAILLRWRERPDALAWAFLFFFAAGGFASIHLIHKDFGAPWHFGRRHALTAFFAFFLSWLFLVRNGGPLVRRCAVFFSLCALAGGGSQMVRLSARSIVQARVPPPRAELVRFLEGEGAAPQTPLTLAVAGHETQRLALLTRERANYHWLHARTNVEDLRVLFTRLGVRLLLVQNDDRISEWTFLERDEFRSEFVETQRIDGYLVFEPRPSLRSSGP